jgi:hypothetical protein
VWIKGSKTCSIFNEELGTYFYCKRGMRQDDSLSSFLFDLVAYVLNILLQNTQQKRYIKGLGCKCDFLGLVNLHFADNTLLFLEVNPRYIEALK